MHFPAFVALLFGHAWIVPPQIKAKKNQKEPCRKILGFFIRYSKIY